MMTSPANSKQGTGNSSAASPRGRTVSCELSTVVSPRGFTLLIAVVFSAVVLALGSALLDIAYKQVLLSSSSRQSEYAFYNADSALECALYYDQRFDAFDYTAPYLSSSIICDTRTVSWGGNPIIGTQRVTDFDLTCPGVGIASHVKIYKDLSGKTSIYANGYSTCDSSNPNRVERGLKAGYGP